MFLLLNCDLLGFCQYAPAAIHRASGFVQLPLWKSFHNGKTRAIHYISKELKKKYGKDLPVYVLNMTDHKPSAKYFYSETLKAIGCAEAHKGTASMMKERLIDALMHGSRETRYRRAVIFIDEAFLLTEKDFIWLMDIYNNLDMCNIHLTVLMFGTNELKSIKSAYCQAKRFQIVDRFILNSQMNL